MTEHEQEVLRAMKEQLHSWFIFNHSRVGAIEDAGPTATVRFELSVADCKDNGERVLTFGRKETFDDPMAGE